VLCHMPPCTHHGRREGAVWRGAWLPRGLRQLPLKRSSTRTSLHVHQGVRTRPALLRSGAAAE
jgi:hypothetical protein